MKLRIGFVTNSSSSSFTIAKSDLTDEQIEKIKNYFEAAKKVGMNDFDDLWDIDETNFGIIFFSCPTTEIKKSRKKQIRNNFIMAKVQLNL